MDTGNVGSTCIAPPYSMRAQVHVQRSAVCTAVHTQHDSLMGRDKSILPPPARQCLLTHEVLG